MSETFFLSFNKMEISGSLTAEIFSSSVQREGDGLFLPSTTIFYFLLYRDRHFFLLETFFDQKTFVRKLDFRQKN